MMEKDKTLATFESVKVENTISSLKVFTRYCVIALALNLEMELGLFVQLTDHKN